MDHRPVRDAYTRMAVPYIDLVAEGWPEGDADTALVRDHLGRLRGPVLDLGGGPGHWSGFLHALGVPVTGVDLVPAFLEHARAPSWTGVPARLDDRPRRR